MTTTEPLTTALLAEFLDAQGPVPLRHAMIAWDRKTKGFAVVQHPDTQGVAEKLGLNETHGACWYTWTRADGAEAERSTEEILAMLNAEVLRIVIDGEANPAMVRLALANIPEWDLAFGENADWPFEVKLPRASTPTLESLVGQFFHSLSKETGHIEWQGKVIGRPEPGFYLLQLCEWGFGEPSIRRLARIEDMADWLFYRNDEEMRHSWEQGVAREGGKYRPRPTTD